MSVMLPYILRRVGHAVFVVLAVLVVVFLIIHLSGDPAAMALGPDSTKEQIEEFRREMGFDRPLVVQFLRYLRGIAKGDFGLSLRYNAPALPIVVERIPATLELTLAAMLIAVGVGLPCGVISALRRNTVVDLAVRVIALIGQSAPVFWLGIMLAFVFALKLRLLPSSGRDDGMWSLILPAVTLSSYSMASIARLLRAGILDVMQQDYIRTARAKGLRESVIVLRHLVRNGLIPVLTVIGPIAAFLVTGSFIIEYLFAIPGIGRYFVSSISARDYGMIMGTTLFYATVVVLANLIVDILYAVVDPRIRYN